MTEPETSQYKKSGEDTENKSPPPAQYTKDAQKGTMPFSEEQVSYLRSMLKEYVSEAMKEVRPSDRTPGSSQPKGEC